MTANSGPGEKLMKLRYEGVCRECGTALAARELAIYERSTRTVRCPSHSTAQPTTPVVADRAVPEPVVAEPTPESAPKPAPTAAPIDAGVAGASARREFERRKQKREQRIRDKHPRLGSLILALSDDPQTTTAWNTGALGEERLGRGLDNAASETVRILHDRRVPRTRANIDHLAVTPNGVFVIDAKKYTGRPRREVEGGLFRPRVEKLMVGRRDCTKVVDGVLKQIEVVRAFVPETVPIHGVLCFVEADWPLIGGSFTTRDVAVLWPKKLYPLLRASGPLDAETIAATHRTLAEALTPA